MEAEAKPFVEHLGLQKDDEFFDSHLPFLAFVGTYKETTKITVITNGKDIVYNTGVDNVGTVPAALATYVALLKLNNDVDLLINAGTAGGFQRKGARIGDVFLTTAVSHHDRRIAIPGFTSYGIGRLDSNHDEDGDDKNNDNKTNTNTVGEEATSTTLPTVVVNPTKLAKILNYKMGVVSTGNSLDKTEECDKRMLENDAAVKDMEAAAVAWSCALLRKPFLGVKVVTDIVDGDQPTHDEFLANLSTAAQSLQQALPQVLDAVAGKSFRDLYE